MSFAWNSDRRFFFQKVKHSKECWKPELLLGLGCRWKMEYSYCILQGISSSSIPLTFSFNSRGQFIAKRHSLHLHCELITDEVLASQLLSMHWVKHRIDLASPVKLSGHFAMPELIAGCIFVYYFRGKLQWFSLNAWMDGWVGGWLMTQDQI